MNIPGRPLAVGRRPVVVVEAETDIVKVPPWPVSASRSIPDSGNDAWSVPAHRDICWQSSQLGNIVGIEIGKGSEIGTVILHVYTQFKSPADDNSGPAGSSAECWYRTRGGAQTFPVVDRTADRAVVNHLVEDIRVPVVVPWSSRAKISGLQFFLADTKAGSGFFAMFDWMMILASRRCCSSAWGIATLFRSTYVG